MHTPCPGVRSALGSTTHHLARRGSVRTPGSRYRRSRPAERGEPQASQCLSDVAGCVVPSAADLHAGCWCGGRSCHQQQQLRHRRLCGRYPPVWEAAAQHLHSAGRCLRSGPVSPPQSVGRRVGRPASAHRDEATAHARRSAEKAAAAATFCAASLRPPPLHSPYTAYRARRGRLATGSSSSKRRLQLLGHHLWLYNSRRYSRESRTRSSEGRSTRSHHELSQPCRSCREL